MGRPFVFGDSLAAERRDRPDALSKAAPEATLAATMQTIQDAKRGLDSDTGGPVTPSEASEIALTTAGLAD